MRKLGRLGTKTKHKDLSNFVSLIGGKQTLENDEYLAEQYFLISYCFRTIGLLGSSPIELNPEFQSDQPVDLHTPPVCQVKSFSLGTFLERIYFTDPAWADRSAEGCLHQGTRDCGVCPFRNSAGSGGVWIPVQEWIMELQWQQGQQEDSANYWQR